MYLNAYLNEYEYYNNYFQKHIKQILNLEYFSTNRRLGG